MNTIGPQRAMPSSAAKISAEVIAAKQHLRACEAAKRLRLYWDVEVTADYGMDDGSEPDIAGYLYQDDVASVVDAFYRQLRIEERQNDPPTREMLLSLGAIVAPPCGELVLNGISWLPSATCPTIYVGTREVELNAIDKLCAALLLLGIETEGVI